VSIFTLASREVQISDLNAGGECRLWGNVRAGAEEASVPALMHGVPCTRTATEYGGLIFDSEGKGRMR
jgi:hypothetical protein